MSSSDPPALNPDAQSQLSSVWACQCDGPVKDIQISGQGVVAVATEHCVNLYIGAPNFGGSHELLLAPATLTAFKFSANGADLITGSSDGFLRLWEVHSGDETCSTQFPITKLADGDDGDLGAVAPPISAIACSNEGELVAATGGRTVCIFGHGGEHLHTIGPLPDTVRSLEWRKNNELAVNVGVAISIFIVDEKTYQPGKRYTADMDVGGLTVLASAPGGRMMAAGCKNGSVRIWDLSSESEGKVSVHIKGFLNSAEKVGCLAWDESGHYLATAGGSDVIVWDMDDAPLDEGKDNSIVCYGHGQNAKITALTFQPNGKLLATGGDDCQVLVFDSSKFDSRSGMVGRLVGCVVSGRVEPESETSSITALAWHPSGLILAGTTDGKVDAFEAAPATNDGVVSEGSTGQSTDMGYGSGFLVKRDLVNNSGRQHYGRTPQQARRNTHGEVVGWGGQRIIPSRADDSASEKQSMGFFNRRRGHTAARPTIEMSRKKNPNKAAKHIMHQINSIKNANMSRASYPDTPSAASSGGPQAQQSQQNWPVMHPSMMRWSPYSPQMQYPPYMPHQVPSSPMPPYQPPASQPGTPQAPGNPPGMPRVPMPNPQQQSGQYPINYVPYPAAYMQGYPPPPYAYYAQMPPQHMQVQEGMPPQPPPSYAGTPVAHPPQMSARSGSQFNRGASSSDLGEVEDVASQKSSEATNNGVNGPGPVTPSESSASVYDHGDGGRAPQTLYIGNLAPTVDENFLVQYFSPFGPIMNIQVIRDRDTRLSRGFAFVTYAHPTYAHIAMQHMDTMQLFGPFEGRRLKVSFSNRR